MTDVNKEANENAKRDMDPSTAAPAETQAEPTPVSSERGMDFIQFALALGGHSVRYLYSDHVGTYRLHGTTKTVPGPNASAEEHNLFCEDIAGAIRVRWHMEPFRRGLYKVTLRDHPSYSSVYAIAPDVSWAAMRAATQILNARKKLAREAEIKEADERYMRNMDKDKKDTKPA